MTIDRRPARTCAPVVLAMLAASCRSDYRRWGRDPDEPDSPADTEPEPVPDATCAVEGTGAARIAGDPGCSPGDPPAEPYAVRRRWSFDVFEYDATAQGCRVTAAGDIDLDGYGEVMCTSDTYELYVIDGRDGSRKWQVRGYWPWSPIAIADLDGVPGMEIVGIADDGVVVARRADESILWTGDRCVFHWCDENPFDWIWNIAFPMAIADLDADGAPEVVTGTAIIDGATGVTRAWLESDLPPPTFRGQEFAIADLDGDGLQEVLTRWAAYEVSGALRWTAVPLAGWIHESGSVGSHLDLAVVQADGDPLPEVAWVTDVGVLVTDGDGTVLTEATYITSSSTACAGTWPDGPESHVVTEDGQADAIVSWQAADPAVGWVSVYDEETYGIGCSTFDLDGDGVREVITTEEDAFTVRDATSGAVLATMSRYSGTVFETPLVVDLDGDASVEIVGGALQAVLPVDDGTATDWGPAVYAYEHSDAAWPAGTTIWPYDNWSGTGIAPDGTVETDPEQYWLDDGRFRGQVQARIAGADVAPEITDSCVAEATEPESEVRLAVRIANVGPETAAAGTPLAVYVNRTDGALSLRDVLRSPVPIDAGTATPTWEVVLDRGSAIHGLVLVAGDDGTGLGAIDDCDRGNNTVTWSLGS